MLHALTEDMTREEEISNLHDKKSLEHLHVSHKIGEDEGRSSKTGVAALITRYLLVILLYRYIQPV